MEKRQAREVRRELTAKEQQRWQAAQDEADRDKQAILAEGRRVKKARSRAQVALRDGFKLLKAERQALGLSLSDVEQRSGIGRAALSRLENEAEPNPTLLTLTRYAEAVGKQLVVGFRSEKGS
jgi:predicted transcriptional regulator